MTIEDVIKRNTDAMGGYGALKGVQSVEIELHITNPDFEVDGLYRAARPGQMRMDVQSNGKHVFAEAFDGKNGWEWSPKDGVKPESSKATAALRHGIELPGNLFSLMEMRERGHHIEFVGRETVEAIDYCVLRLTLSDGYVTSLYVDPNSWLITRRRDVRPLHPDIDPTPTTIELKRFDFHAASGIQFPFKTIETDLATGKELERTKVQGIKINPPLDRSIFEKP